MIDFKSSSKIKAITRGSATETGSERSSRPFGYMGRALTTPSEITKTRKLTFARLRDIRIPHRADIPDVGAADDYKGQIVPLLRHLRERRSVDACGGNSPGVDYLTIWRKKGWSRNVLRMTDSPFNHFGSNLFYCGTVNRLRLILDRTFIRACESIRNLNRPGLKFITTFYLAFTLASR